MITSGSDSSHTPELDELRKLREENARLRELLARHNISWEGASAAGIVPVSVEHRSLSVPQSSADKISLFRKLFRGRNDVYPQRWESAKGKSGYSPVCENEWRRGVCQKPRLRCGECSHRVLLPITDQVLYAHLSGKCTIGVYPLLSDDTCYFLAADFDDDSWQEDSKAFM